MSKEKASASLDPEISAIAIVYDSLQSLEPSAQVRVLQYVAGKLGMASSAPGMRPDIQGSVHLDPDPIPEATPPQSEQPEPSSDTSDGISAIAQKWMRRNGLVHLQLSRLFSVNGDEIDLIAESVPGDCKKAKTRSVALLKGVAAYLATGAPRVSHKDLKETCLHYDAFDTNNFASYIKDFSAEVSGSKQSGYALTPRGLAAATELIKKVVQPNGSA